MKKVVRARRGILLLETVVALMLLAAMAGAAFPLISHGSQLLTALTVRLRLQEEGLFAADYMTDRIRRALGRSPASGIYTSDVYPYKDYDQNGKIKVYRFYPENQVWYLQLYDNKGRQPLTGDQDRSPTYAVGAGTRPYFMVQPGGLVMISYQMKHGSGEIFDVETAVLPLYDYFRQGESYE